MKAEYWTIAGCALFFAITAPIYWWLTYDPTGTTALVMTFLRRVQWAVLRGRDSGVALPGEDRRGARMLANRADRRTGCA